MLALKLVTVALVAAVASAQECGAGAGNAVCPSGQCCSKYYWCGIGQSVCESCFALACNPWLLSADCVSPTQPAATAPPMAVLVPLCHRQYLLQVWYDKRVLRRGQLPHGVRVMHRSIPDGGCDPVTVAATRRPLRHSHRHSLTRSPRFIAIPNAVGVPTTNYVHDRVWPNRQR